MSFLLNASYISLLTSTGCHELESDVSEPAGLAVEAGHVGCALCAMDALCVLA